ncbi:MAG TPA: hypothetical protein VEH09_05440, partial [Thermodesulfobacteriota bacterium]|nr:hypothetical protein [Thermodesulfobacteriota bacterium]
MKAWQGLGTQGRSRRKHRREIASYISLAFLPQGAVGRKKKDTEDNGTPPPQLKGHLCLVIASKTTSSRAPEISVPDPPLASGET